MITANWVNGRTFPLPVVISDLEPTNRDHAKILALLKNTSWAPRVALTGFLPKEEVWRVLAAADAVLFPFRQGGGEWNTSLHAAMTQGTFVLASSTQRHGYQPSENVYYSLPGDTKEMRAALITHVGVRRSGCSTFQTVDWKAIAAAHMNLHRRILGRQPMENND